MIYLEVTLQDEQIQPTGLVPEEDSLLVLSLLDGSLVGVDRLTGQVRWTLHNGQFCGS